MKITGVAWLSSVRVVKCWINFLNERNPSIHSQSERKLSFSISLEMNIQLVINQRKGGITSSPHDPYGLGYTRVTMVSTKRSNDESRSKSQKTYPSSDCSLQLENMKPESLVIVDQHATVNMYLSLVLPARHGLRVECIRSNVRLSNTFLVFNEH